MRPTGGICSHCEAIHETSPMNKITTPNFGNQLVPTISSNAAENFFAGGAMIGGTMLGGTLAHGTAGGVDIGGLLICGGAGGRTPTELGGASDGGGGGVRCGGAVGVVGSLGFDELDGEGHGISGGPAGLVGSV